MAAAPAIELPSHAYVPGQTRRHDEAAFDAFKASVHDAVGVGELSQTLAWRAGLAFFEAGYFWEAHEVLEPVWLACPQNSDERRLVQAVIQLANAGLKLHMQRPRAAARLVQLAAGLEGECRRTGANRLLGLDLDWLTRQRAALADDSDSKTAI